MPCQNKPPVGVFKHGEPSSGEPLSQPSLRYFLQAVLHAFRLMQARPRSAGKALPTMHNQILVTFD